MTFRIMLFAMYIGLKFGAGFTSLINKTFKSKLKEKDCTLLIKTKDNKIARSFTFKSGKISSKKGVSANPSLTMIWSDAKKAVQILRKGKPDLMIEATADGTFTMQGDASVFIWFIVTVGQMLGAYGIKLA